MEKETLETENEKDELNENVLELMVKTLEEQLEYYQKKNTQHHNIMTKLKINPSNLSYKGNEVLRNLIDLHIETGIEDLDKSKVTFKLLEDTNKTLHYQNFRHKIDAYYNELDTMIKNLQQELDVLTLNTNVEERKIENFEDPSESVINKLRMQIKSYEDRYKKNIVTYPWLNDSEYNLLHIHKKIEHINKLQDEKNELQKHLNQYCDLKPNLADAKNQLIELKNQYHEVIKEDHSFN